MDIYPNLQGYKHNLFGFAPSVLGRFNKDRKRCPDPYPNIVTAFAQTCAKSHLLCAACATFLELHSCASHHLSDVDGIRIRYLPADIFVTTHVMPHYLPSSALGAGPIYPALANAWR